MEEKTTYDWFNALMEQQLSTQEIEQLKTKLETDKDFREAFAFLANARKSAQNEQQAEWRQFYRNQEGKRRKLWSFGMVASILLLVVAGWWFFGNTVQSTQEIYAQFDENTIDLFQERGIDSINQGQENLNKAISAFKGEDWAAAVANFDIFLALSPSDAANEATRFHVQINRAIALRNIPTRKNEAIADLLLLRKYKSQAEIINWQLALTYLKINEIERCLEILEQIIATENHDYSKQATSMKEKINRLF